MELLARLLGGIEKVKIMRLFLHYEEALLSLPDIVLKTKSKSLLVRKELAFLVTIGFLEKKRAKMVVTIGGGRKISSKVKEVNGYRINPLFPHHQAMKALLFDFKSVDKRELAARFKAIGRIKLFITAGVFIGDEKSRVDLFIVGEAINRVKAEKILESISSELGREVIYSIMDVEEYEYRYKMYDKFVRDIMDMDHEKVIDKLKELKK